MAPGCGSVDRLNVEEELRFLDQAYAQDGRTGLMLQTLQETSARSSELVQLRVEDVSEPRRESRRLFCLSQATIASSFSCS